MSEEQDDEISHRQRKRAERAERGMNAGSAKKPAIVQGAVPPREVLLEFISDNPDKASKREIAKASG